MSAEVLKATRCSTCIQNIGKCAQHKRLRRCVSASYPTPLPLNTPLLGALSNLHQVDGVLESLMWTAGQLDVSHSLFLDTAASPTTLPGLAALEAVSNPGKLDHVIPFFSGAQPSAEFYGWLKVRHTLVERQNNSLYCAPRAAVAATGGVFFCVISA